MRVVFAQPEANMLYTVPMQSNERLAKVFDTNGAGDLLEIDFRRGPSINQFYLNHQPCGAVRVAVETPTTDWK